MKSALILLLLALAPAALAQEGSVTYQETVKLRLELPPEMQNANIPRETSVQRQLLFNESEALIKTIAPEEPEQADLESESGGMRIRIMGARADEEIYTNYDQGLRIEKRDFLGRQFLVTGETPEPVWRLTDEQSQFLGYTCRKAVTTRDSIEVEAWFTPEIPVPAGPGMWGGLPGLILVLNEDEGQRSFVAKEVQFAALETPIVPPTGGKEVTRAEFDKIVEDKMKEMGAERGRGGAFRIRIQN